MIRAIKEEFLSYSRKEKFFIFFAMLVGFCITSEHAIIKPTVNSIFIATYGVKFYPYAWLGLIPLNLLVVSFYNRTLHRFGCFRMLLFTTVLTILINLFAAANIEKIPHLAFALFIWKDIYVMLMFQQLWAVIHSKTKMSKAKYLYGILHGIGAFGATCGSLIPSFLAVKMGSQHLLFATLPIFSVMIVAYYYLIQTSEFDPQSSVEVSSPKASQGLKLIKDSRQLKYILLIVMFMQISCTIIEYQFSSFLELKFTQLDLRTEYYGRVMGSVHTVNLFFQFIGSFILVQYVGLKRSHSLIPLILCCNAIGFLLFPYFAMITFAFASIKSFDYSLFSVLKEMLYVPLKTDEKFKAKAIIDVFAYRSAKVFASFFVLFLQFFLPGQLTHILTWVPLTFFVLWVFASWRMLQEKDLAIIQ